MKTMSRALLILAATALMAIPAQAATITLDNVISTPGNVTADIVVGSLNEATGGFALQVAYNAADFSAGSYTLDPGNKLGDGVDPVLDLSFGFGSPAGFMDLFVVSTMTPAQLIALQGPFPTSFILASVNFTKTSSTVSGDLSLTNMTLSNADGTASIPLGVPDQASTMWLLGSALGVLAMHRRKAS